MSITPVGSNNNIMIHAIEDNKVLLHPRDQLTVIILFLVSVWIETYCSGGRINSADYPGNNDEYSVSGYHYDKKR